MDYLLFFAYLALTTYGEYILARFVYRRLSAKGVASAKDLGILCFIICFFVVHVAVIRFVMSRIEC